MKTVAMLSNHHIHLSEENARILFGDAGLTFKKYLAGNSGPYATEEVVTLKGPKGELKNIRVLGPCRGYTQAELLKSDCYKLGVDAPVRSSGKLEGAATLEVIGPCGTVTADCGILALRHIHVNEENLKKNGLQIGQFVKVRTEGVRGLVFENVEIVKGNSGVLMHIDTEEGNAAGVKNGDMLEVITD